MSDRDNTPVETPIPYNCDTKVGKPCPYHTEILAIRTWRNQGIDELLIVNRRRDRWAMVLIGGILTTLLAISTTAIWGGVQIASEVGQLRGSMTTRLNAVETFVEADRSQISRMERASSDGQTTVLVTLGEMREQLRAMDARMARVEEAQNRNIRR
jgi:hypothetical protein